MGTISRKAWGKYAKKQEKARTRAERETVRLIEAQGDDVTLYDAVRSTLMTANKWSMAAAGNAAKWYDRMAHICGADVPKAEMHRELSVRDIRATAQDAAERYLSAGDLGAFARACGVAAACEVKRAANQVMIKNAKRDDAELAWLPGEGETCGHCATLSAQGWQKAGKIMSRGERGEHIHGGCSCEYAVRFDASTQIAGYTPQ